MVRNTAASRLRLLGVLRYAPIAGLALISPLKAETVHYRYDALGRIVHVTTSDGPTAGQTTKYQFDPAGNRSNYVRQQVIQQLSGGQSMLSPDGRFQLSMQLDGNLVLYMGSQALWDTHTWGTSADRAVFQPDGNLVVYAGATPLWSSGTWGNPGSELALQNDGNLVIYSPEGVAIWSSGTCCH